MALEPPQEKILQRAMGNAVEKATEIIDEENSVGDSPIEKLLFAALVAEIEIGTHEHNCVLRGQRGQAVPSTVFGTLGIGDNPLIILHQIVIIDDWHVDFVIQCSDGKKWHSLVVECDGHNFHERTKEQAARDRSRDRRIQEKGYAIFRFTGSEIYNEPCECADQIIDWACRVSL